MMNPPIDQPSAIESADHDGQAPSARKAGPFLLLCGVTAALLAGLLVYSQIQAFSWDEGYHLLAAQLIQRGQRPYLDFCFPQTPLNAYWNAAWMQVFGGAWRITHVAASLLTAGAILLAADFVLTRFPAREWRLAGAITAALLVGMNESIVEFGTIAQPYALCLFLTVAAFRISIFAVNRSGPRLAALAGFLVSAAAASSLLTAPAAPVLLAWMLLYNRNGSRWAKLGAFLAGALVPFLPVLWLLMKSPHQVFFNLFRYHLFYRRSDWEGATAHDLNVLTSWIDSGAALLLGLLAVTGLLFIAKGSEWNRAQRSEFYLCGWLAGAVGVEIASAHPTFAWYFLLVVPFLAILAVAGLHEVASRMYKPDRPVWPVALLSVLLSLALVRALRDDSEATTWGDMQAVANKVDEVTPPQGTLWAGEQIYFLTRRPPPDGMELAATHKMDVPMAFAAPLHILPKRELDRRVKEGMYGTIAICDDDHTIKELALPELYAKKAEISSCTVFWDKVPAGK
ncbi:MAG TPA: hypothetical protein VGV35_15670 [Bryobacteraceae bacterium]|nr:hypothetical protein [Bryobacteraceae bacterium]